MNGLAKVPTPPALDGVEILQACDLSNARQYIRNKQVLVDVERKLSASALNAHVTIAHAKAVAAFAARLADPAVGCKSAWGPDADRRAKLLTYQAVEGSILGSYTNGPKL